MNRPAVVDATMLAEAVPALARRLSAAAARKGDDEHAAALSGATAWAKAPNVLVVKIADGGYESDAYTAATFLIENLAAIWVGDGPDGALDGHIFDVDGDPRTLTYHYPCGCASCVARFL